MRKLTRTLSKVAAFSGLATLASLLGINLHGGDKSAVGIFNVAHADTPGGGDSGSGDSVVGCDSCCGASNANGDPGTADGGGGVDGGGGGGDSGSGSDGTDGCCY
jgi:hypothetical protein